MLSYSVSVSAVHCANRKAFNDV